MNRNSPRITLRIDRIVADQTGLSRSALQQALHREISRTVAQHGVDALSSGSDRQRVKVSLPAGQSALASRVAAATVKAVKG